VQRDIIRRNKQTNTIIYTHCRANVAQNAMYRLYTHYYKMHWYFF